jgi:hypothetical protein
MRTSFFIVLDLIDFVTVWFLVWTIVNQRDRLLHHKNHRFWFNAGVAFFFAVAICAAHLALMVRT